MRYVTQNELRTDYFEWMYQLVCNDISGRSSYRKLLAALDRTQFSYIIGTDASRADDGIDLRYRFGYDFNYDDRDIASYLDTEPCTMLEMMVALALRCEEHIMEDSQYGDRTSQWFWEMIVSLGLQGLTDDCFDQAYFMEVMTVFLNRQYQPNGKGGLFTIKSTKHDMRASDIWYQLCWYLNEIN